MNNNELKSIMGNWVVNLLAYAQQVEEWGQYKDEWSKPQYVKLTGQIRSMSSDIKRTMNLL
jgi:hypothetical protein